MRTDRLDSWAVSRLIGPSFRLEEVQSPNSMIPWQWTTPLAQIDAHGTPNGSTPGFPLSEPQKQRRLGSLLSLDAFCVGWLRILAMSGEGYL